MDVWKERIIILQKGTESLDYYYGEYGVAFLLLFFLISQPNVVKRCSQKTLNEMVDKL